MAKSEGPDLTNILIIGGVAYGAYWYLTNYGPSGQVAVPGGPGSYWAQWFGGSGNVAGASTVPATQGASATGQAQAPSPSALGMNPQVTFNTAGGNNQRIAGGEAWQVSITGAVPNAPVTVVVTKAGGASTPWNPGNTDGQGNFTTSGVTDPANVGQWTEVWSVGGRQIAILSFTVVPAPGMSGVVHDHAQGQRASMSFHGAPLSGHGFRGGKRPMGQKSSVGKEYVQ